MGGGKSKKPRTKSPTQPDIVNQEVVEKLSVNVNDRDVVEEVVERLDEERRVLLILGVPQPVEQRIMRLLADGKPHTREEVHACLADRMAPLEAIKKHMTNIRKVVEPYGETVLCRMYYHKLRYQWVKLLRKPTPYYLDKEEFWIGTVKRIVGESLPNVEE